jgi:hypothetical protein
MRGHAPILPPGEELLPLIGTRTYDDIGEQHGVSRQAVFLRVDTYCRKRFGMGIKEYRETNGRGYSVVAS